MATMSLQAAYDQARSYLEANKVEQATGVAQHILEQFPENLEAHRILGEAYLAGRQFDQAEAAFSRVLHADPENIPAHVGLGITFERQGKLDRAVAEFEQALEVRPDMPELRSQLLRLYTDIWGSEGATLRLSRPGLARLYAKGHMLPQAIQEFRSVIEETPERFDARVGLAEALWRDGQEQAAAEACEEILAERSDVLKANLLLGYIKLANSDESGEPYWRLAQQLDPYQNVARALFETLPDLPGPELYLPAWDEDAWAARRAEEERSTVQLPAIELDDQPAFSAAATGASAADDLFSASWLDEPDVNEADAQRLPAPPPREAERSGFGAEDDDFLATLLALDTPPLPADEGSDLDSSSGVTPFSFDDFAADAPPTAGPPAEQADLEPFSLSELGLSDDEITALSGPGAELDSAGLSAGAPPEEQSLAPLSLEDLGLSDDEIAQLEGARQLDQPAPEPFSFEDLDLNVEPAPETGRPGGEPEPTPFSLEDLDLNAESAPETGPRGGEPEPTPFSLEDLDLNAESAPETGPRGGEPELAPFSLEDLGLSPEEIAQLNAVEPADQGALTEEPPASGLADEPGLTPFSLEDLGLSPEEIAGLEAAPAPETAAPPPGDELAGLDPFDWGSIETPAEKLAAEIDNDIDLSELTPFSLDDLDLDAPGDAGATALPSSLQPFSLEDAGAGGPDSLPAVEPEETDDAGGYSWQQPAAKKQTDFTRQNEPDAVKGSIFGRLRQAAAERPAEEPPPLPPVSDDEAGAAGYFSDDDISLRLEETTGGGSQDEAQPLRFTGSFRLPKEGADLPQPEAVAGAAAFTPEEPEAAPPAAEEPELTPFSLEDLGLSPEEIAQLEATESNLTVPEPPAKPEAAPPAAEEPELTPFSLEDLGLSPEEIAQLESAGSPDDARIPATGETIVPGWSQGEEPELTPFSPDDFGLDQPSAAAEDLGASGVQPFSLDDLGLDDASSDELGASGVQPFSLDDLGLDDTSSDELGASGVQPFSLDDLGLNDFETPAVPDSSRELGVTAEELAGLDLGEFESAFSEPPPAEDPDAAFERLMNFGQEQGFVDLTDIIAVVSDPEAEADRIEEIGWALHRAGIEIRDGDEVIDMEEGEAEEAGEIGEEALVAPESAEVAAPAPVDAEPDLTPFSLEELGLTPEEIAALGLGEAAAPAQPEDAAPAAAEQEPELTPFSLEDLGLSPEEIAQLEATEPGAPEAAAGPEPAAPAAAEQESELTPFSLEDLGLSPEEIAQLNAVEPADQGAPAPAEEPPASGMADESELTPFSLEDLGLSPEEIAQLEAAEPAAPEPAAPETVGEPELTPFSLEDLGLSPEEIAQLEAAQAEEPAATQAEQPAAETGDDMFDFGLADVAPVEKVTKRTEPRAEEPPPAADPADTAFTAEPLDTLDDIWQTPAPAAAAEPARVVLPPISERPAARRGSQDEAKPLQPPRTPAAPREAPPARPTSWSRDDGSGRRASTRGRDDERYARREEIAPRPAGPAPVAARSFGDFVPTGDEGLDEYLRQLESEPGNYGLAMAIGRLSAQTGRADLMSMAYKGLIKEGRGIDEIAEELEGLVGAVDDTGVQRQLYRLLGDTYSKQGRLREAMAAYGYTFGR